MRILSVEDHADSATWMALMLRKNGHVVQSAATAADALRLCGEQPFDLLIADIGLPECDGWRLMRQVRQRYNLKSIALTGYDAPEDVERSREAGFDAHLIKPIKCDLLATTMAQVMTP